MIDLRSDLCAVPTEEMWEAMRAAELGWASRGEDPSVNELEGRVADLLGKPSAVWVPTCGMANLAALLALTRPGEAVVLEATAHILTSEGMWLTELAHLVPCSLWAPDGRLDPEAVAQTAREERATVVCLENSHTRAGGRVVGVELTGALARAAHEAGARVHLDGARLANAAVALGVPLRELAVATDTVALSLNKGLCAPIGTVLAGDADVIDDARVHLQRLGGGTVHKAGIPAAAGLVALDTMVDRLADDHRRARDLAALIAEVPGLHVQVGQVETNIVLVDVAGTGLGVEEALARLAEKGILALERDTSRLRFVTHRLIGDAEVAEAASAISALADRL